MTAKGKVDRATVCSKCGTEFVQTEARLRARVYRCRDCIREAKFNWDLRNPEKKRHARLRYQAKHPDARMTSIRKYRSNPLYEERRKAREAMRWAITSGAVERPAGTEFHHPDYSRPYFGCFVTPSQHQQIHAGRIPCPPCTDYTHPKPKPRTRKR